jgi:hypothetical protein
MMLSNSYPQALSTTVDNGGNTPKATLKLAWYLTRSVRFYRLKRAADADCSQWRINLVGRFYVIAALLSITSIHNANAANYSIDHLKLYAHSRLLDYKEFQCFNKIITKESQWSYLARNGSHYGLGQMRSKHYRDLDPFRQIDATISYNHKRYVTQCNAWSFHLKHGYY